MRRVLPHVCMVVTVAFSAGCLPQLPENAKPAGGPQRTAVYGSADATLWSEEGVNDALWLEVQRGDGSTLGGYVSQNDASRSAVVILLHGASTFEEGGGTGSARHIHTTMGGALRNRGFRTWAIAGDECGTPYGRGDADTVVTAVDWLEREGKVILGVERVYVVGYSNGGTAAVVANRQRKVDAVSTISALMEPYSIENRWDFWRVISSFYPYNIGACQMVTTLDTYGRAGSPGWDILNTVAHIDELKSPMLVFHGDADPIFETSNAVHLWARYDELVAQGAGLPELQFVLLPGIGHFPTLEADEICGPITDFFEKYGAVENGTRQVSGEGPIPGFRF